jgi:hypothetical protein
MDFPDAKQHSNINFPPWWSIFFAAKMEEINKMNDLHHAVPPHGFSGGPQRLLVDWHFFFLLLKIAVRKLRQHFAGLLVRMLTHFFL